MSNPLANLSWSSCLAFLCALSLLVVGVSGAEGEHHDDLRQLSLDTFKPSIAKGIWLVEYYSPSCGHCRAFAPTWEQVAAEKRDLETTTGFHMAQVNCIAQGDLCAENEIKFYPSIRLYKEGEEVEQYSLSRDHDVLSDYIDKHSKAYAQRRPAPLSESGSQASFSSSEATGEVITLAGQDGSYEAHIKSPEPIFVKFFAPWCGHCQKLAPTWKELAENLKGKLKIAEVDCVANPDICKKEGVMGYPMLYLYAEGKKYEHTGGRSLSDMSAFATKALASGSLEYINAEAIESVAEKEEIFFLYLNTFADGDFGLKLVSEGSKTLLGSIPLYQSRDPDLFTKVGVDPIKGSALLSFKDNQVTPLAAMSVSSTTTAEEVGNFLQLNKLPTIVQLGSKNFGDVMRNKAGSLVVLAGFKLKGRSITELEATRDEFLKIATAWRKGGRKFDQGVIFAWMDGDKWGKWLKQTYGMSKSSMPSVVVADPKNNAYYDITLEFEKIRFDGASIFSTLEGAYQRTLTPKKVESWTIRLKQSLYRSLRSWINTINNNVWKTSLILLTVLALCGYGIRRFVLWDYAGVNLGYQEKLSNRLD